MWCDVLCRVKTHHLILFSFSSLSCAILFLLFSCRLPHFFSSIISIPNFPFFSLPSFPCFLFPSLFFPHLSFAPTLFPSGLVQPSLGEAAATMYKQQGKEAFHNTTYKWTWHTQRSKGSLQFVCRNLVPAQHSTFPMLCVPLEKAFIFQSWSMLGVVLCFVMMCRADSIKNDKTNESNTTLDVHC